jgi:hypothetical protein
MSSSSRWGARLARGLFTACQSDWVVPELCTWSEVMFWGVGLVYVCNMCSVVRAAQWHGLVQTQHTRLGWSIAAPPSKCNVWLCGAGNLSLSGTSYLPLAIFSIARGSMSVRSAVYFFDTCPLCIPQHVHCVQPSCFTDLSTCNFFGVADCTPHSGCSGCSFFVKGVFVHFSKLVGAPICIAQVSFH